MKVWHSFYINIIMIATLKIGEHVTWNSEAGHIAVHKVQRSCSPGLIAYSL